MKIRSPGWTAFFEWSLLYYLNKILIEELSFCFDNFNNLSEKGHFVIRFLKSVDFKAVRNLSQSSSKKVIYWLFEKVEKSWKFFFDIFAFYMYERAAVCPLITSGAKRKKPPTFLSHPKSVKTKPMLNRGYNRKNQNNSSHQSQPRIVERNGLPLRRSIPAFFLRWKLLYRNLDPKIGLLWKVQLGLH